jgi:hypothetical protein
MPYIKKEDRASKDKVVDVMVKENIVANGDLNYVLFKYCKYHIPESYNDIKNYCGELNECAAEIRRKLLAKYEDKKIIENSDV